MLLNFTEILRRLPTVRFINLDSKNCAVNRMRGKKGDSASNAGAFLAVLTVLIILYVLFLPPADREKLLIDNQNNGSINGSDSSTSVLLQQNIGRVDYINTNEKTIDIPTVRVYASTSSELIKATPSIAIRSALFDHDNEMQSIDFSIDKSLTDNLLLSFNVVDHSGPLIIELNGRQIFNSEITSSNSPPITLDKGYLTDKNTLVFKVPNPGWAFWKANKYSLENIKISGEVTNLDNSESVQRFVVSEAEKNNLNSAKLAFHPVCTLTAVGTLNIELNGRTIFSGVGDCGSRTPITLDKTFLVTGANELKFSTNTGSYLIDTISVKLTLDKPTYNTFYFDMKDDYFKTQQERARCGDYDGVCPAGCEDVRDADCCFNKNGLWCGLPTDNPNDRCVYYVAPGNCGLCKTGYYDRSKDPASNCEAKCGDNTDGVCPSGCSALYDADCCYNANPDNFFCQEVPITGINDRCRAAIDSNQCELCSSGYENKDGSSPDACVGGNIVYKDENFVLLDNYDVKLTVRFINDIDRKKVDINVNGRRISIDTRDIEYTKIIDDYVRQGTNSIEIVPIEDIDIAELKIELKRVR
jgi:hypothetical protein